MDRRRPSRKVELTTRDLELLSFVAEHRLVLADHVGALLGVSAAASEARLRALATAGFVAKETVFHRQPACYQVMHQGLAAVGSRYPKPRIDVRCYRHDVGVAWLWLAARSGVWGPMRDVVSERQLRSVDGAPDRSGEPMGVRLGGVGPHGRARLHYPDLLLITPDGHRVALELELTSKGRTRREKILAGYAADPRIDAVVYLVEHRSTGRAIEAAASRLGIKNLVHVQEVRWDDASKPPGANRSRQRGREQLNREDAREPAGATRRQEAGR